MNQKKARSTGTRQSSPNGKEFLHLGRGNIGGGDTGGGTVDQPQLCMYSLKLNKGTQQNLTSMEAWY
jgi:hypothetical protein